MQRMKGYVKSCEFNKFYTRGNRFIIAGYASKAIVDRVDDLVLPQAFSKSLENFRQGKLKLPLFLEHGTPIGKVLNAEIREDGFYVEAEIASGWEEADKARKMIQEGVLNYFSIGFTIPNSDGVLFEEVEGKVVRVIKDLDLLEISVVSVPANAEALFEIEDTGNGKNIQVKSVELLLENEEKNNKENVIMLETKKVSGKTDWPLADRDRLWDADSAVKRLRKWASEDGSGDPEQMDWKKYQLVHFWYDDSKPENFTSYKLPFCDVIDGKVYAIPRGIFAVAAVLQGARGGVDIPEKDIEQIKKKVETYYHKLGEKAPWEREKSFLLPEEFMLEVKSEIDKLRKEFIEFKDEFSEIFSLKKKSDKVDKKGEDKIFDELFEEVKSLLNQIKLK